MAPRPRDLSIGKASQHASKGAGEAKDRVKALKSEASEISEIKPTRSKRASRGPVKPSTADVSVGASSDVAAIALDALPPMSGEAEVAIGVSVQLAEALIELEDTRRQLGEALAKIFELRHSIVIAPLAPPAAPSPPELMLPAGRGAVWARPTSGRPLVRWTLPWAGHLFRNLASDEDYRLRAVERIGLLARRVAPLSRSTKAELSSAVIRWWLSDGPRGHYNSLRPAVPPPGVPIVELRRPARAIDAMAPYDAWLRANAFSVADGDDLRQALALRSGRTPKISVIMPVYNTPPALLREAVESVISQVYQDWELCIADDCSPSPHIKPLLAELAALDGRIKVRHLDKNGGIAVATNASVDMATGDVVAFVDHDDLITPDCLAEVAIYYADNPTADMVYSDDDKIDMDGKRFAPQFKPGYSDKFLLSFMYLGHIFTVRRDLFLGLEGFDRSFDGSQDYDFALRASERARHVGHIPKVLYSWRVAPGSTAAGGDAKPEAFEAGRRAVAGALTRRGVAGAGAVHPDWALKARCGIYAIEFPDDGPSVTLVIPTRNKLELLKPCVESLARTTYKNFKIMVVDNESDDPAALDYMEQLSKRPNIKVERISNDDRPFSYARVNNEAVRRADSEYILLLNNDTELREPRWLSQMVGYARMAGVGAVGAKLLFEDGTIQHAGIVHGYYDGLAGPAFRGQSCHDWGYLNGIRVAREVSAVTAACLLMKRDLYQALGGLDEKRFNVAYNDVDLCYRIVDAGYTCIYCPDAELFHYEGKTRGHRDNPRELAAFRARYAGRVDPWYNVNLSLENENFEVRGARMARRSRRPVRAVMVSHNLQHEGAPNSMLELVLGLKRRGLVDPVVLSPADGPLRQHYEAAGVTVHLVHNPIADIHELGPYQASIRRFTDVVTSFRPEVVYGNTLQTFWAMSAARQGGVPAIWNPRESEPWASYFDYLAPPLRPIAYEGFVSAYAVVFVAHATKANWAPMNRRRNFRVIHNGISHERLTARAGAWTRATARESLGLAEDEVAIVLVGTVCDRKGQIDLVQALPLLSGDPRKVRVFIVGDRPGAYSDRMKEIAQGLSPIVQERLVIVPETGDPYRYFQAGDIAVCTSRVESYPRIILEAMACGLPIVTTNVFGISEQVREGINAFFYEQQRPAALAQRLDKLIVDTALRSRMADASPNVLSGLTLYDEMLSSYAGIFREAAGFAAGGTED